MTLLGTDSGNAVVVAIDHGQHSGVYERFEDPVETLDAVLAGGPDGVIAGVPFLRRFADRLDDHPGVARIATVDLLHTSTFPGESEDAEIHRQVFSVEAAARTGADAVKAALVYGRRDPDVLAENTRFIASAAEEARAAGLETVVEPTLWGQRAEDELDADRLANANRIGFEVGADVLKSPYPGTPGEFAPIVENAPVPVLIAGGPAAEDDAGALEMVRGAMDAGARGVMIGRNIWQRPDPAAMTRAIRAIVHDDAGVERALDRMEA
jgi:class I fructose-bisphosphate aldolase